MSKLLHTFVFIHNKTFLYEHFLFVLSRLQYTRRTLSLFDYFCVRHALIEDLDCRYSLVLIQSFGRTHSNISNKLPRLLKNFFIALIQYHGVNHYIVLSYFTHCAFAFRIFLETKLLHYCFL